MELDEVKRLVQEAQWFSNLGHATESPGFVPVTGLEEWAGFIGAGVRAEFDLPGGGTTNGPLWRMDWLPTSPDQDDPVHGSALKALAEALGRSAEFRTARLEMHRLALVTLRGATEHPLLRLGATDLTQAASGAALFACRQAASEAVVSEPGFWCSLLPIYSRGNWPVGKTPTGEVVVL